MSLDNETILLVTAYHDGELSPFEALAMQRRIAAEPELQALVNDLQGLSSSLKHVLSIEAAPERLRGRVVDAIGLSDEVPLRRRPPQWRLLAASVLIGMVMGGAVIEAINYRTSSGGISLADSLYQAHLRSLAAPQPFDIASSDRHVVKPWFNGRTSVSPAAPDLSADGFPLIGGRIDIVSGISVPVLVYKHDRHIISVTVLTGMPDSFGGEASRDGSNFVHWNIGDLNYWAVSDLNDTDLRRFAAAFSGASG